MHRLHWLAGGAVFLLGAAAGVSPAGDAKTAREWPRGKTYSLKGMEVSVSAPVLVGRSGKTNYWYPKLVRLADGTLIAHLTVSLDGFGTRGEEPGEVLWSSDGGLTWENPKRFPYASSTQLQLANGDLLFLP